MGCDYTPGAYIEMQLVKLSLELSHTSVFTSHKKNTMFLLIHALMMDTWY